MVKLPNKKCTSAAWMRGSVTSVFQFVPVSIMKQRRAHIDHAHHNEWSILYRCSAKDKDGDCVTSFGGILLHLALHLAVSLLGLLLFQQFHSVLSHRLQTINELFRSAETSFTLRQSNFQTRLLEQMVCDCTWLADIYADCGKDRKLIWTKQKAFCDGVGETGKVSARQRDPRYCTLENRIPSSKLRGNQFEQSPWFPVEAETEMVEDTTRISNPRHSTAGLDRLGTPRLYCRWL